MPYHEVGMVEVKEVIRLWMNGYAKKRIAAQLGLDRRTVRKYVRAARRCGVEEGSAREPSEAQMGAVLALLRGAPTRPYGAAWDMCVQQKEFIASHLKSRVRLSKVCRLLRRRGIEVPYGTLYRYAVAALSFGVTAATIPVADGEPGNELQLDTGWMTMLEPDVFGKRRRFRAWVFTPNVSRYRFAWPCFKETTESAIEACEAAWVFYGGVFPVIIPDNTKTIVNEADPLEPKINVTFLEYAQARGFVIDPARVRHPKDKARTERAVRDVRDDCFGGERIHGIPGARERARYWCREEYGMRRHTTTGRLPSEHFAAEEQPLLLPVPERAYDVPIWANPKVGRDQYAQIARGLYSLPTRFVGRRLHARADKSTVRFYDAKSLVKTHPRAFQGKRSTDVSDFPAEKTAYAMRDITYLERKAREHGEAVGRYAHALLDCPLPWTRMRRVYALLRLVERYEAEEVNEACVRALEVEMIDVKRLKRMLEAEIPQEKDMKKPEAKYLRPADTYSLPILDRVQDQGGER